MGERIEVAGPAIFNFADSGQTCTLVIDESLIDEGVHTWCDAGSHSWIEESVNNEIDESLHSCAPPPIYRTPMSIHPQALTTRILLTLLSDRVARRLTEFGPYDIMSKGAVVRRQVGRRYGRGRLQIAAEYDTLGEGSAPIHEGTPRRPFYGTKLRFQELPLPELKVIRCLQSKCYVCFRVRKCAFASGSKHRPG